MYPTITVDSNNNAYIAWTDSRNGNNEIYFQKIPVNFAPITGTRMGALSVISTKVIALSSTLESPTLVSPNDSATVTSLRPTFKWKHAKGNTTEYNLDLAKNDTFTISKQTFNKTANTGSPDETDSSLFYYNYSIHEFDPGLDKDTYY